MAIVIAAWVTVVALAMVWLLRRIEHWVGHAPLRLTWSTPHGSASLTVDRAIAVLAGAAILLVGVGEHTGCYVALGTAVGGALVLRPHLSDRTAIMEKCGLAYRTNS